MLVFVRFLFIYYVTPLVMSKAVIPATSFNNELANSTESSNTAVKRLQEVFGISDRLRSRQIFSPPQYMLNLYASVADNSGLVKAPNPYGAHTIRSYTEKAFETTRRNRFSFDITGIPVEETLLEAELHLFISKSEGSLPSEIRVYQTYGSNWTENQEKNRLIDVHYVDYHEEGWQIFKVTRAVTNFLKHSVNGHLNFLVTAVSATDQPLLFHVSRRRDKHHNRQPILVLFNSDSSRSDIRTHSNDDVDLPMIRKRRDLASTLSTDEPIQKRTPNHNTNHHHRHHLSHSSECHRQELYVDFESIGWSEWIIAPKGYNAYHCSGVCSFPLGQSQKPTNHATVQSIIHEMNLVESVGQPCCVPNRLLSLSLLYYDENDNVVLKQYGEMVADSCGCH